MAPVQVNIRMDGALKQAGDEVLERYGFSATQAVRMLWEYAARNGEVPDFMLHAASDEGERAQARACRRRTRGGDSRCARGRYCLHATDRIERGAVGGGLRRAVRPSCRGGINGRAA